MSKQILLLAVIGLAACSTPKSFFTADTRNKVEEKGIPLEKLQFYIDKDVELRRELSSRDATVHSGKVKIENGKYINIILLKQGTLGVCTGENQHSVDIAFESGESKSLVFDLPTRSFNNNVYSLDAEKWLTPYNSPEIGKITYDGDVYFMRFSGPRPKLMVKKTSKDKFEVNKRVMSGRKIG